ncbi:hypothetical protein [Streptomyces sp. NBC_00989]|uniref:hypothetical protein n=1 Tax=Streptomyces sp. NBC_00989 TaxID=2903705 RepID=UPI0038704C7C|nr:hypothetical protein OG714_29195 [Streptomyces sp. NBC_00989]
MRARQQLLSPATARRLRVPERSVSSQSARASSSPAIQVVPWASSGPSYPAKVTRTSSDASTGSPRPSASGRNP